MTAKTATRGNSPRGTRSRPDHGERGSILIETAVTMALIGLFAAGVLSVLVVTTKGQRTLTSTDIAAQHSQGVLERAQATPWADLGLDASVTGYRASDPGTSVGPSDDRPTVTLTGPATVEDPLVPLDTYEISGGVQVTQRVDISWVAPVAATTSKSPAAFGTKQVTVRLDFTVPGESEARTETYSMRRSSTASETLAEPTGLDDSVTWTGVDTPPGCPVVSATTSGTETRISWTAVSGATQYRVYKDEVLYATTTSTLYVVLPGGPQAGSWTVNSVIAGQEADCDPFVTTTASWPVPPTTCPTVTLTRLDATRVNATWTTVAGATFYRWVHTGSAGGDSPDFFPKSLTFYPPDGAVFSVSPGNAGGVKTCAGQVVP